MLLRRALGGLAPDARARASSSSLQLEIAFIRSAFVALVDDGKAGLGA